MVDMEKPIPIGIEFYKEMIDGGYYYVDKTLLIRDILKQGSKVMLFTRPRRFGKTLAQSTLQNRRGNRTVLSSTILLILWGRKSWMPGRSIADIWDVIRLSF